MKTVVTELLAFLFIWISLCFGRVLLTGGNSPSICSLPKETGECRGAFSRWYYNTNSDKCEVFIYGGCGGNENNFGTRDECEGKCTANTGEAGHPQLLKLFARKNARITDKTSVKFRRRLRRQVNSTLPSKNNTLSSSSKSGTPASNLTRKNSPGQTSSKANFVNQSKNGTKVLKPIVLPSKSRGESPLQTKSSSSKSGTPTSDVTQEDSSGQISSGAKVVNQSKTGISAEKQIVLPSKSRGESPLQTKSSSSKSGTPTSDLTSEIKPTDQTSSEPPLVSPGGSKGKDGKSETRSPGEKKRVKSVVTSSKLQDGKNVKSTQRKGEPGEKTETPTPPPDESSGKIDGFPFQPEEGTNENLEEGALDFSHLQTSRKDSAAYPYEHTSSHFAAFFLTSIVMVFAAYVVYHNRQKIIAIVIEGRSDVNGRRRGYRKLETNVEESMPSLRSSNSTYVY